MNGLNVNILTRTDNISRDEWLDYRAQYGICGSEVASVLGVSPWMSTIELWLIKTGQRKNDTEQNEAMLWGSRIEKLIRERFTEITNKEVIEIPAILQNSTYEFLLGDVDGITYSDDGEPAIFEAKCVSQYKESEWADDKVPEYYLTQMYHYMMVCGIDVGYFACLIGGNHMIIREVHADPIVQQMLLEVESNFWRQCKNMERPQVDSSQACTDLLNSIYRGGVEEEIIMPDDAVEYIDRYIEASAQEDSAKAIKNECANHLREIMGDYDKAKCYGHIITWKPITSERLDNKLLKEKYPDVYEECSKKSTYRRFQIK